MTKIKWVLLVIISMVTCSLFSMDVLANDMDCEALKNQIKEELKQETIASLFGDTIDFGLLIEAGVAYVDENEDGNSESDFALTTVELALGIRATDWIRGDVVFLFEDPTFDDESDVDVDVGTISLGNTEKCIFFMTVGKMYVPFGALLTSFPDDPLVDVPVTLTFGEINEKTLLVGFEKAGVTVSAYLFNGDVDDDKDNNIESFGFDVNYASENEENGWDLLAGASYISNVADTDGLTDALLVGEVEDYIDGLAVYFHLGYDRFFFDAEYMTALDSFENTELVTASGNGAEPSVWNLEFGFNYNWWKPLAIALKYAGSDDTEGLGTPDTRYGLALNQEIHDNVVFSVGYLWDEFDTNVFGGDEDTRNTIFSQIAIEF